MALPASGTIYISQVNDELGYATTRNTNLNESQVRTLFARPTGYISLANGHGKTIAGSAAYGAGTHTFTVPWYKVLYVEVRGAGAGGTGGTGRVQVNPRYSEGQNQTIYDWQYNSGNAGGGGGTSVFYSSTNMIGYGGGPNAAAGGASGGSYNAAGGGSGGGLGGLSWNNNRAASGGAGGVAAINFSRGAGGAPVPYTGITVVVGYGGGGGAGGAGGGQAGAGGAAGYVYLSWY